MVNANELRIGNWVTNPNTKIFHQITPMDISDLLVPIKYREAVSLTPEIVTKCGFENLNGYYVNKSIDICHIGLIHLVTRFNVSVTGPFGMVSIKSIKYLHQLQNLYFALTGQELPITL